MLKFRVFAGSKRFFYHGVNGGNVTIPCSESDGYKTEIEAHKAVKRLWRSMIVACGGTPGRHAVVDAPYTRDSLKP